ncbi:MAG: chromosome segregation protein SMC [gamma proteobacterium symbiont of Bathyaustriella thionipta]|nr:chromosome segregation protein SMC [gamma proteobacterium symbiont of Bathyaustriella thionipta]
MRLEKIKLAGFKSFVDPTTVALPSNLVAIVGPNGCGKSNVIDAVRWVMGESSAKMLRGESMADVIFNGSNSRKPVGSASIELLFDNSDGKVGGEYATYGQISVKRQVSRDGQSHYFLNSTRCRRRDITDLFLGTGLGPRSYSIIEQGMISRVIEAKPEELRVYLEEAAGISKYKERRKETEKRIAHTRDNLDRLNDLTEEVGKQLQRLEKQSKIAEKYKLFKVDERRFQAELLALNEHQILQELEQRTRTLAQAENRLQARIADLRNLEKDIEQQRAQHNVSQQQFNEIQGRFYEIGSEIARLEQAIKHHKSTRLNLSQDIEQLERSIKDNEANLTQDQNKIEQVKAQLAEHEPQLQALNQADENSAQTLARAESAMADWDKKWDTFNQHAAQPSQTAQVERTRINHFEEREKQNTQRLQRLQQEQQNLQDTGLDEQINSLRKKISNAGQQINSDEKNLQDVREDISRLRTENRERANRLNTLRGQQQKARGRMSALQALHQSSLGKQDKHKKQWLEQNNLIDYKSLSENIKVDKQWRVAVEAVLGQRLQMLCGEALNVQNLPFDSLQSGALDLLDNALNIDTTVSADRLSAKIETDLNLAPLLASVLVAEDLRTALSMRAHLQPHESIITAQGVWLGPNWVRYHAADAATSGVLQRIEEIKQLQAEISRMEADISEAEADLNRNRQQLQTQEAQQEQLRQKLNQSNRSLSELNSQLGARQTRLQHLQNRHKAIAEECQEIEQRKKQDEQDSHAARSRLHEALAEIETLAGQREALVAERDQYRENLNQQREGARQLRKQIHEIALKVQSLKSSHDSLKQSIERLQQQDCSLLQRHTGLKTRLQESADPLQELQQELEKALAQRVVIENELSNARALLQKIDFNLREKDQQRATIEQNITQARTETDRARAQHQENEFRLHAVQEQLQAGDFNSAELMAGLPADANPGRWQEQLEQLQRRIQRLGPINLAAIDEFEEHSERMQYLQSQSADVNKSLETLENAIRKIDRETRTRFKETYDKVNAGIQRMFPKLFGGGHAYLELTGDDLLDTGVTVMARPPGKRNTSIHLLSGGEKALTAVSLVFSIFELNPAPFCMLDEVDAPLDDANVGRFCQLVREMSEHVQFIFITHNKVTMELANQLSGVTMHEPGVSRLVTVDVAEAAQLVSDGM